MSYGFHTYFLLSSLMLKCLSTEEKSRIPDQTAAKINSRRVFTSYFTPSPCWFPNMYTCIHFCSPPSGVSGRAPEWEWINNMKVWLDLWDPDSGFHFPDRESLDGVRFCCLATFSRKAGTMRRSTKHPKYVDTTKGVDSFFLSEPWGKIDTEVVHHFPDVANWSHIRFYVTVTVHFAAGN